MSSAALSDEALAELRHRAEYALAADGVARTRLGYEVLVKLTMGDLVEREDLSAGVRASHGYPRTMAVGFRIVQVAPQACTGAVPRHGTCQAGAGGRSRLTGGLGGAGQAAPVGAKEG